MKQRFSGTQMVLASGAPLEDLRLGKNRGLALDGRTGELNAYDKRDLARQIGELMTAVASGELVHAEDNTAVASGMTDREIRRAALESALADTTGQQWMALGSSLAQEINEQADREGFLRRIAVGSVLKQGEIQRVPMPSHTAQAIVATSASNVGYQTIRQKLFTPDEFEIQANVRVENLDLEQINGDLLEKAYNQGLEAIMVQEDRLWKKAADDTVGIINKLEYIAGALTTKNLGNLRQTVARWNLPVSTLILSNDYWADIIGSNDFATMLDPISKYDLVLNGQLGTLVGMNIITDAFRQPNQKVLDAGEMYVVSDPENHAAYSTRGGVRSTPTTGANDGNSTRGWFMTSPFTFVLGNVRSVAKGKRI
jgi:hypothetical protein